MRSRRLIVLFALVAALTVAARPLTGSAQTADAAARTGEIAGTVVDQKTGLATGRATVVLTSGTRRIASTTTDANGRYAFGSTPAGIYSIEISAEGFGTSRSDDIVVTAGETIRLSSAIAAQATGAQNPRVIGSVTANSGGNGLQQTTVIS